MVKAVIFDMYETLITLYGGPPYFGTQMAADAGISEDNFKRLWSAAEKDRSIGKISLEEILERILKENHCYSEDKLSYLVQKRIRKKEEAFRSIHKEVIPMLYGLKERGILLGLISNCYSEESSVIKRSILYPYFDAVCLSYDEGVQKPDRIIFQRCLDRLNVRAKDCLYVGDGGSYELETAEAIGMRAVQAVWYLKENTNQPSGRRDGFEQVEKPLELLERL